MTHLNRVFGAHVVSVLTGQYEDPEGQAMYYRIPLGAIAPDPELRALAVQRDAARSADVSEDDTALVHDLAGGLTQPFAHPPESLVAAETTGLLYGPAVNKITLMNYTTTATVRAMEWITALVPKLPHLYLTSSRDESIDKALRLIKFSRKQARIAIGLEGGYLGHTVAVGRSLSDPDVHRGGPGHFDWPRLPHPADVGVERTIDALRAAVGGVGGPENVLGFVYELVQERTGRVMPDAFWPALTELRKTLDIPLIAVETTTSSYRSGVGPFAHPATGVTPDVMLWWGGGQTGYVHCTSRWFVPGPLTLVSTWDGDELSLVRQHHQLRAARRLDIAAASKALDTALAVAEDRGLAWAGQGLYRVLGAGDRAVRLTTHLRGRGLRVRGFPGGRLGLIPALDDAAAAAKALASALAEFS